MSALTILLVSVFQVVFSGILTPAQNDFQRFTTLNFPSYEHQTVKFDYNLFATMGKFFSFIFVGVIWYINRNKIQMKHVYKKSLFQFIFLNPYIIAVIPSILSLLAFTMGAQALLYGLPSSIYSMLRGTIIFFTPITNYLFFRKKITIWQIAAIFVCFAGLGTVAVSSICAELFIKNKNFISSSSAVDQFLGIVLIVGSEVLYSFQFSFEELLMKKFGMIPAQVLTLEGIYGFLITILIAIPIEGFIMKIRNQFDGFVFFGAEPMILLPYFVFMASAFIAIFLGQTVTQLTSANHRAILNNINPLSVWIFGLIERQILGSPYGEEAYGWASWLEAFGFLVDFVGILMFNNIIKCQCKSKQTKSDNET